MKNPKNNKPQKSNIDYIYAERNKNYQTISNYHIYDKRLTLAEKGFLTALLMLPNNWKITQRATSDFLGISDRTFNEYIQRLKEIGYIEVKKTRNNRATYIVKEQTNKADFNPKYIKTYTLEQINKFLNDSKLDKRYINLLNKELNNLINISIEQNKALEELKDYKPTLNDSKEDEESNKETEEVNNDLPF